MRRRDFIAGIGSAAASPMAWPLAARAQQRPLPVIGYVGLISPAEQANTLKGFHKGLGEAGFVEGRNVAIEYRWAQGQKDRMPQLAAELISRRASIIFLNGPPSSVRAARAESATIPIVFLMGEDPVKDGLVPSLNRPGGNSTGITDFANQLAGKRMGLLHDTVPKAAVFALLINPTYPNAEFDTMDARAAAAALGREFKVLTASTEPGLRRRSPPWFNLGSAHSSLAPILFSLAGTHRRKSSRWRLATPSRRYTRSENSPSPAA